MHSLVVNDETNLLRLIIPYLNNSCQIKPKRATTTFSRTKHTQERTDQQQERVMNSHCSTLVSAKKMRKCSAALTDGGVRAATQARLRLQGPPGGLSLATCKPRDGARFRSRCPDRPAGRSPPPRARERWGPRGPINDQKFPGRAWCLSKYLG